MMTDNQCGNVGVNIWIFLRQWILAFIGMLYCSLNLHAICTLHVFRISECSTKHFCMLIIGCCIQC